MDLLKPTGFPLLQLTLQLHADLWQALDRAGVTPLQAYVLLYVQENEGAGARPSDIARQLRVRVPTISELLRAMKQKKWLTSRRLEYDRRSQALGLTKAGQAAMRRAVVALDALAARYNGAHTGSAEAIRVLGEALKQ